MPNSIINRDPNIIRKHLNVKERKVMYNLLNNHLDPESTKAQQFLSRPHVAIAFEAILDKYHLSDDSLIKRLAEIIRRRPIASTSEKGIKSSNVTATDANARDTIRLLWQVQGKFVDKHEIKGEFHQMEDKELDSLITSGVQFLVHRGKVPLNDDGDVGTDTG